MSGNFGLDFERLPKELKLLLDIINLDNGLSTGIKRLEGNSEIDWNFFLELAIHHRLYPIIYANIKMINQNLIPQFVVQTIYKKYKKNTFEMLHLSAEMESIGEIFSENEIRLLILKGPVLAADLYNDLSRRTCRDLDILISLSDLEKAGKLLLELGYEKDNSFQMDPVLNDWKWRHHHIAYNHPNKRVRLEIHWRLNPGPGKEPTFHELWERRRISFLTTNPVYYLGREDLFFFLITHGARHGWSRLRWLVDIHQIIGQSLDWNKAKKLLKDYQSLHLGVQALLLSSLLLNSSINNEMLPLTRVKGTIRLTHNTMFYLENMVNLHSQQLPENISKYHNLYLFSLKSVQHKFLYLISIFYPSITDVNTFKLPKCLYGVYFLLRPLFLVLRKMRKQALT